MSSRPTPPRTSARGVRATRRRLCAVASSACVASARPTVSPRTCPSPRPSPRLRKRSIVRAPHEPLSMAGPDPAIQEPHARRLSQNTWMAASRAAMEIGEASSVSIYRRHNGRSSPRTCPSPEPAPHPEPAPRPEPAPHPAVSPRAGRGRRERPVIPASRGARILGAPSHERGVIDPSDMRARYDARMRLPDVRQNAGR